MKTLIWLCSILILPGMTLLLAAPPSGPLTAQGDILRSIADTTVSPAKDFFAYATGTWVKNNPIPESESMWDIGKLVQEETYSRLKKISEDAAASADAAQGTPLQKIGAMWATGMDTNRIEEQGILPLKQEFERINQMNNAHAMLDVAALFTTYEVGVLFDIGVYQDEKNSDKEALHIYQGGLGLPNRDYYFNTDARTANIRKEYVAHIARMMQLLGDDDATAKQESETIMKIETALADSSRKLEDLRDPYRNYNKMAIAEVNALTPTLDWNDFLKKVGVKDPDTVVVGQPEFLKQLEHSLQTVSMTDWRTYFRWHLISAFAPTLSKAFDMEYFKFRGTVLEGKTKPRDRWKRILDAEEAGMGELLGQLYVKNYYSESTKQRYQKLTNNILDTYRERIEKLDWMSPQTKEKAVAKLSVVTKKVGYPDKWKDYSALEVDRNSYAMNVLRTRVWSFNHDLNKLGKPVDRTEWDMTPQTYNAYYNPSNNEIVLPAAAFIIPGLPDSLADDAVMYAYAGGSTIGHEITHGFDDEGRQFDAKGNLSDWWTPDDEKQFNDRAKLMVDQFNSYVVLDSMHVNGKATLGENIADLGGVILGFEAFQKTDEAKEGKAIAGFTPNQRYFLAYALSWLGHQRDQRLARQIMTDVHSPAFLRVNGPLSDIPEFYQAFDVKPGDPMFRPENVRPKIW